MKEIKIPAAILDVFREAAACDSLSKQYGAGWFPSPRALVYAARRDKLKGFATKALFEACPAVTKGLWVYDYEAGVARRADLPAETKVRKPRVPRATKVAPVAPVAFALTPSPKAAAK